MNQNDYRPFNLHWLDSTYQQTSLPDSPWHKVCDQLEPILAKYVRGQFQRPHRQQILIELLGKRFLWTYFLFETDRPYLLDASHLTREERQKLENEAKSWLQLQTHQAAVEVRAVFHPSDPTISLSMAMGDYFEYLDQVIRKSLQRYFYRIEQVQSQSERFMKNLPELQGPAKIRAMLRNSRTKSKKLPIIKESSSAAVSSLTSNHSEILSNSLIVLLKHDIRWIGLVKQRLFGCPLPSSLRQWIWTECLLRFEKKPTDLHLSSIEFQVRRDFAAGIRRGKSDLKLTNPLHTPISNLIENAVIEIYSSVSTLQPFLEEQYLRSTIQILNILYTFRKAYQSYSIYWLFPFQQTFRDEMKQDDGVYFIAMHLNLFLRHCFPQWAQVFALAQKIIDDLAVEDERFFRHLQTISKIRPKLNPKDFMTEMISLEGGSARKYIHELSSDPVIYLRKWIGQIFVGIVNSNAVLFLWDQFFLVKWNSLYLEYTAKALLYLLRDSFFSATDSEQMRKVFIDEPVRLLTMDIRSAYLHLAVHRANPRTIPSFNRRVHPLKSSLHRSTSSFDTIVVKNISLTLLLRKEEVFDCRKLTVDMDIYAAQEKLAADSTRTSPILRSRQSVNQPWTKYLIDIVDEKLLFRLKETRPSSVIAAQIQALVTVRLQMNDFTSVVLGHCRFPLYIPQKIAQLDTWDVTFGPVLRALHPGPAPPSIEFIPDVPRIFHTDKIGPGSSISLVIFDSKAEAHFHASM